MVRNPICAYPWQPVSFVRQQMLENNFSYLPIWDEQGEPAWRLVSDYAVARYLHDAPDKNGNDGRNARLAKRLRDALAPDAIKLVEVQPCCAETSLEDALEMSEGQPLLVVVDKENRERLVGILTPFDLL